MTFTSPISPVLRLSKPTVGSNFVSLQPSIPSVLYGRSLQFRGVELCYTASANAALSYVEINTFYSTTGAGSREPAVL